MKQNRFRISLRSLVLILILTNVISGCATKQPGSGDMFFQAITASAIKENPSSGDLNSSPWEIPVGYRQDVISDEQALNIYPTITDWPDMLTSNETGPEAGRYLYRSHEVRPKNSLLGGSTTQDAINVYQSAGGGTVSVIDLETKQAKILVQNKYWEAVDGIVWTPWQSLLITQETKKKVIMDPTQPQAKRGLVYEIKLDATDLMNKRNTASYEARPLLGSLAHEGIDIDAHGNVYVIDENTSGAIYKFIPDVFGNLNSGQLYALKLTTDSNNKTGPAQWIPLDMSKVNVDAHQAAKEVDASTWCRPEDVEVVDQKLFVAITCGETGENGEYFENRVISITLDDSPVVSNFVLAGLNVAGEGLLNRPGFRNPDNLAKGPHNSLWIIEDNSPSDIWVASLETNDEGNSKHVALFASLADGAAEGTGIYFGKDPETLFVNIQHSGTGNDKTMTIKPVME